MLGRLFTACLLFAVSQITAPQTEDDSRSKCVLDGTAVDFASGEPVHKAKVRLFTRFQSTPGQMAITEAAGHFHFENVPEGEYQLTGERTGYLDSEFGARQPGGDGTTLRLKAGEKVTALILKLARCSVISGKVSDENGDPIPKAGVYAVSRRWIRGQVEYFTSNNTWTDDAGNYRMVDLPPGRYYLCADHWSEPYVEKQGGVEKRLLGSLYPGSQTLEDALPLDVQSGQDLPGINFQLHTEPVFHIIGKLVGKALHDSEDPIVLSAHPKNLAGGIMDIDNEERADGSFDFPGAPAGVYEIELSSEDYKQTIARISVEVKKSNVTGLLLPVPNRFELKGVVRPLESAATKLSHLKVVAVDDGSPLMSHPYQADVESDGAFKIQNVWPGEYVFSLAGQGQGDYIKSIQYGGHEVLGVPVEIANPAGQIEIALSGGAGQIDGSVQSTDPAALLGGLQVVLASEESTADARVRMSNVDQNGDFSFQNIPPGKYYAFAIEDVDAGLLLNKEFVAQFRQDALEIEVTESSSEHIRVPILPAEDLQRAFSALRL